MKRSAGSRPNLAAVARHEAHGLACLLATLDAWFEALEQTLVTKRIDPGILEIMSPRFDCEYINSKLHGGLGTKKFSEIARNF
jgi:hypothetical protein